MSATCRNCGEKMWNVPSGDIITSYDLGRIPEGAVGGWVWCNQQCLDEWKESQDANE